MKSKVLIFTSLVLVLTFGFLYMNQSYLSSNDKDGKQQCTSLGCQHKMKNQDVKAGGSEWSKYEFVSDKVTCEDTKASIEKNLMSLNGIKEVKFGSSCSYSGMTSVIIYYSPDETNEAAISSFVKDKEFNCPNDGSCPPGKCKDMKSKDTKKI